MHNKLRLDTLYIIQNYCEKARINISITAARFARRITHFVTLENRVPLAREIYFKNAMFCW